MMVSPPAGMAANEVELELADLLGFDHHVPLGSEPGGESVDLGPVPDQSIHHRAGTGDAPPSLVAQADPGAVARDGPTWPEEST